MSSPGWKDVEADLESMMRHFEGSDELYKQLGELPDRWDYVSTMALLHSMQSGYTSAEAALVRILSVLREERPTGPDWHQVLIRRLATALDGEFARPALLSPELAAALQEARSFRHRAMHVYDDFDIRRFPAALTAAKTILRLLPQEVEVFRAAIDG